MFCLGLKLDIRNLLTLYFNLLTLNANEVFFRQSWAQFLGLLMCFRAGLIRRK